MVLKRRMKKKISKGKAATKRSPKKLMDMLLVGTKTREALKGKEKFNVSGDTIDALNDYIYKTVEQAQKRCKANGRKTIRAHDIWAK